MGKKSRKNIKHRSNVSNDAAPNIKNVDVARCTTGDNGGGGGGLYADYVQTFGSFLHFIAPDMSPTNSVQDLVGVVQNYASLHRRAPSDTISSKQDDDAENDLLRSHFMRLFYCFNIRRDLFSDGFEDEQLLEHLAVLRQIILLLAPLVDIDITDHHIKKGGGGSGAGSSNRRPTSPTAVAGLDDTHHPFTFTDDEIDTDSTAHCWEDDQHNLRENQIKPIMVSDLSLITDCKFTIGDLWHGNDCFRAATFLKTAAIFSGSVVLRWDSVKRKVKDCRARNEPVPLFEVMLTSLETQQIVHQVNLLEQDWIRSFPQYHSRNNNAFANMIAVAIFDKKIKFLVQAHDIDKSDAVQYVADLVQAAVEEPQVPSLVPQVYSSTQKSPPDLALKTDVVLKVFKSLTKRGVPRPIVKELVNDVVLRVNLLALPMQTPLSQETALLHTHYLVAKSFTHLHNPSSSSPGLSVVDGVPDWNERDCPAPHIALHMDKLTVSTIVPNLINFLRLEHAGEIVPWNKLYPEKDSQGSFSFSFAVHCTLISIMALQGNDDVKSIAIAARVSFAKWCAQNDQDSYAQMGVSRGNISLWNPFIAGVWLAKLIRTSHSLHPDPADSTNGKHLELMVRLYEFLRDKVRMATVPMLEALTHNKSKWSTANRRGHHGDALFVRIPDLLPLRQFASRVDNWSKVLRWDQDFLALDMPKTSSLILDFQGIMCTFFVGDEETVEEWVDTLMVNHNCGTSEQSSTDEVALCFLDFFVDKNNVVTELFH